MPNRSGERVSPRGWVCRPGVVEVLLRMWHRDSPDLVTLDFEATYTGHMLGAATVTGPGDASGRGKLLSVVPHAHEPAGTAASVEFLSQLISGRSLAGDCGTVPRERLLEEAVLTVIPAGNPWGLSRAPISAWDGKRYTNAEFWKIMKGVAADGFSELPWRPQFDDSDAPASHVGIVYEQIGAASFGEPNRCKACSLWTLIDRLSDVHQYRQFLNLHQGMEAWTDHDTWLEFPTDEWLPDGAWRYSQDWSEHVLDAFEAVGGNPKRETGHYVEYRNAADGWSEDGRRVPWLIDWLTLKSGTSELTVEVQNNNHRTPPAKQRLLAYAALVASAEYVIEHP